MKQVVSLTLRIPIEDRDWLKRLAYRNKRSMNNQIVSILQELQEQAKENAPEVESSEALDSIPTNKRKENEYDSF